MKKWMTILLVSLVVISCCSCNGKKEKQPDDGKQSTPGISAELTPEQKFGHIDQLKETEGVYKIWSDVGVKNMVNHPEAKFELLCNIDMEGAVVSPIGADGKAFTGEINGANFVISNFTVQGGEETDFGFVGVNKGEIRNLQIQDVTFVPGKNATNIGSLAGNNAGAISRCGVSGTMTIENIAENGNLGGLAGVSTGIMKNTDVAVDLNCTAAAKARIGGIAGTVTGGTIEYINTSGKIDAAGENKTIGLFAGNASDTVFTSCVFLGASNTVNGALFTNFTGNGEDDEKITAPNALCRDNSREPLPENVRALRDKVVKTMYELGTVKWKVKKDVAHSCTCQLSICHGVFNTDYTYYGAPYNHKSSSLARMQYCIDKDGYMKDWIYDLPSYDGFDIYFGTDCSSSIEQAWWTVSNSVNYWNTTFMPAAMGAGTIAVGDYKSDFKLSGSEAWTKQYIDATDEQVMYESYAQMRAGDAYLYILKTGGHTRMCAEDPVVVRDQDGRINPEYSYVISHEQGMPTTDAEAKTYSSWRINYKYTFANIYFDTAIPLTCEELLTGEMEPVEAKLEDGCDGYAGLITGKVKTNYNLDCVTLKIKDSKGETFLEHPMWVTVKKTEDFGGNYFTIRDYTDNFDMSNFAIVLADAKFQPGETYTYTVTASLSTLDNVVVHEGSFTLGTAH